MSKTLLLVILAGGAVAYLWYRSKNLPTSASAAASGAGAVGATGATAPNLGLNGNSNNPAVTTQGLITGLFSTGQSVWNAAKQGYEDVASLMNNNTNSPASTGLSGGTSLDSGDTSNDDMAGVDSGGSPDDLGGW